MSALLGWESRSHIWFREKSLTSFWRAGPRHLPQSPATPHTRMGNDRWSFYISVQLLCFKCKTPAVGILYWNTGAVKALTLTFTWFPNIHAVSQWMNVINKCYKRQISLQFITNVTWKSQTRRKLYLSAVNPWSIMVPDCSTIHYMVHLSHFYKHPFRINFNFILELWVHVKQICGLGGK